MLRALSIVRNGSEERRHVLRDDEPVSIGRAPTNTLSFPDSPVISRQHAVIQKRGQTWVLVDLGGRNGILLNNARVSGESVIRSGDVISLGEVEIQCVGEDEKATGTSPPPAVATTPPPSQAGSQTVVFPGHRGIATVADPTPFAYGRSSILYRAIGHDGSDVCVKAFHQVQGDSWDNVDAFERELVAQSQLVHPHILPVLDYGLRSLPKGFPFVVLPFCAGGNLRGFLRARRFFPLAQVLPILEQLASALDFAHQSGYVHGDIKPENMLLSADRSQAFLSDFGMSNVFAVQERFSTVVGGPPGGTTAYFSPEQISDNQQTPLSDIYAFALTAYELLTGRLPFDPNLPTFKQMLAKVHGEVADPRTFNPQIGDQCRAALLDALQVNPLKRPPSATLLCERLAQSDSRTRSVAAPVQGHSVFVSYSHKDADWLERVRVHLRPLERLGLIDLWDDRRIKAGDGWRAEIDQALDRSTCAVLLVSANFLASDFCSQVELPVLLERAQDRGVRILPLMLSPCEPDVIAGLSSLQSINDPARTLIEVDHGEQERVLVALAKAIRESASLQGS